MRKALNAKAIDAFKPMDKRYEVHDLLCPGFSIRVYPSGKKVFTVKYRYGVKQRRMQVGVYPRLSLAEARARATEACRMVDDGIDPAAKRRQLDMRVEAVCAEFIRIYARPRNRSWKEAERILQRELVPVFGQRDIRQLIGHGSGEDCAAYHREGLEPHLGHDFGRGGGLQSLWLRQRKTGRLGAMGRNARQASEAKLDTQRVSFMV